MALTKDGTVYTWGSGRLIYIHELVCVVSPTFLSPTYAPFFHLIEQSGPAGKWEHRILGCSARSARSRGSADREDRLRRLALCRT